MPKCCFAITTMNSSRPLEFRLSEKASDRIKARIKMGEISILQGFSKSINTLERRGFILNRAIDILEKNGKTTKGCSNEKAIDEWLNRKRGKEFCVFAALCQAVDENWIEVYDRSAYGEILVEEKKKSLDFFIDSLLNLFTAPGDDDSQVVLKYLEPVKQVLISDEIDSKTITELIDNLLKEFAFDGRQIRLRVSLDSRFCDIVAVEIQGKNQNNDAVIWKYEYEELFPCVIETEKWWWKGDVTIDCQIIIEGERVMKSFKTSIPQKGYIWANILFDIEEEHVA